jgi:DNA-binding CsgD family transcriptional regulator
VAIVSDSVGARLPPGALSSAEEKVVGLVLSGCSNEAVARRRGTSARTMANQLASAYRKLGVGSRRELRART